MNGLLIAAILLKGVLAGLSLDKVIVQLPARKKMGAVGYASYVRAADLKDGVAFYALIGQSAALVTIVAFDVALVRDTSSTTL